MKFFSQTFEYDDPWSIVTLAYFLRYPNPYASHVLSCDVISRIVSPSGTLLTKRLILKRGAVPKWFPAGIVSRAETWVVEDSEVDPEGKTVRCRTRNVDNVKILHAVESVTLRESDRVTTIQNTKAEIVSRFGWGLKGPLENHGLSKFKTNIEKSRQGISIVLEALRESRLAAFQPLLLGPTSFPLPIPVQRRDIPSQIESSSSSGNGTTGNKSGTLLTIINWLRRN